MLRHLGGGVGVFILAALDSSVLPTLGAVDGGIALYPADSGRWGVFRTYFLSPSITRLKEQSHGIAPLWRCHLRNDHRY
jgi:hypothetical protein